MAFEIPDNLHPQCAPVAWLLGSWFGSGHGEYPDVPRFSFGQEVIFAHDGRPFFHYMSRSWIVDDDGNRVRDSALETGFLRCLPEGDLEFLIAHNTGIAEIYLGKAEGAKIEMATDAVVRTSTAKEVNAGKRMFGLVEGDLLWTYDMAAMGQPLQSHLWGRLVRQ